MDPTQLPPSWFTLSSFALHVTIHIDPSNVDKFFAAMKPAFDVVAAEPECLYFEIFQDPAEPGKISWVENWSKGVEWFFKEQMTKEYYKPYLEATEKLYIKPREFKVLKRLEGFVSAKKGNFEGARVGEFRG
ncbi:hypothetical protein PRZ48_011570 [Zasmidium cellare]|uniref:ABM domain-containing protein n=1 Tax=Zasmidium cellare TaxID=395010 RepID=A0ABR0E6Q6_ZASCE|nr:hypothetical protein PRZ48_011570 [Zasmidium cellare]